MGHSRARWTIRKTADAARLKPWRTPYHGPRPAGMVPNGRFYCEASRADFWLQDGSEDGSPGLREEGRWVTTCTMHDTRAWWPSLPMARASCLNADFCHECYELARRDEHCPDCLGWPRPCALCSDEEETP